MKAQQPVSDTALDATAYADQTSPAPNKAAGGSASSHQGKTRVAWQGSQSRVQSPCPLMANPFLSDQTNSTPASPAVASPAAVVTARDMHPSLAHGAQTPLTASGSASSSKHAAADGTRPGAAAQASLAGGVSPEAETHVALCPSSSLSGTSQRAADAAAGAASSLTQAAMHLDRATLSERSMQQQRHVQRHMSTQQPQETPCSAGSPSLSACMPRSLYAAAADDAAAAVGQGSPADAAAPKAERGCFFHDPEHSSEWEWDDSNPFLVGVLPAARCPQHSSLGAQQAAGGDGCAASAGPGFACADQSEGAMAFAEAAATAVAAGSAALSSRAAAAVAAGAGAAAFGGPLTSHRSHLPRPSSSRGLSCESRNLSRPEAAAASAVRLAGRGCAWNRLPSEVASLSFAATASLHTKPLPALATVASGQPQKQRAVVAEPGALTVHAGQLPLRPVSKCGLSMWPSAGGRHPGLHAEESATGAAVALQQLSRQQANNQDLIHRLLYAPPAAPAHPGRGCPSVDLGLEPWTGPYRQGCNLAAQQGPSSLLPPEGSAVSSVLDHSTARLLLVQPPPQVLVLGPPGVLGGGLQLPQLLPQHHATLQHQQQWQALQQDRSSVSIAGSAVGPGLTGFSGAHSCIQLGAPRSHAADMNDIVLKTKARAAAKQQQRQHQRQHHYDNAGAHYQQQRRSGPDVTPATPVLATDRLADATLAGGGLKGAAAMLACNLRPDAALMSPAGTSLAGAVPASTDTMQVPHSPLSGPAGTAAGGSSLAAAVRDGDRVLQMLQECKELAELDRAVKSRMMQLLHTAAASQSSTAAVGAQAAAVPGKARAARAGSARCAGPEHCPGQHAQTANGGSSPVHVLSEVSSQPQQQQQGCSASTAHPALGTNSCAGVLHAAAVCGAQAAQAALLRPQTSGSVAGASTADARAQSSRNAADQAHTLQQACMQNKDSPAGKGLVQHSAQHSDQQKAGSLHSSPSRQPVSTKAARQLWQATRIPAAATSEAGPGSVPTHPAAKVLGAAGMPGQPVKGSSVAALVAAVAGRPSRV